MNGQKQQKLPHNTGERARLWRAENPSAGDVAPAEEGQAWAVSYSDLLMVLMSFFIIFFSYNDKAGEKPPADVLQEFAFSLSAKGAKIDKKSDMSDAGGLGPGQGPGNGPGNGPGSGGGSGVENVAGQNNATRTDVNNMMVKDLGSTLKDALSDPTVQVTVEVLPKSVVIKFPEEMYGPRKWKLSAKSRKALDLVADVILAKRNDIIVDVIGHTDDKQVTTVDGDIVTNNFILSSLRASSALDFFLDKGFPKSNLRATGVADSSQGSKTLSLQISAR